MKVKFWKPKKGEKSIITILSYPPDPIFQTVTKEAALQMGMLPWKCRSEHKRATDYLKCPICEILHRENCKENITTA
jgi:hypothetical protein